MLDEKSRAINLIGFTGDANNMILAEGETKTATRLLGGGGRELVSKLVRWTKYQQRCSRKMMVR